MIIIDHATSFTSSAFQEFIINNDIEHLITSLHYPEINGQAERSVRIIKTSLIKITGGSSPELRIIETGLCYHTHGSLQYRFDRILITRRTHMLNRKILTKLDLCPPPPPHEARAIKHAESVPDTQEHTSIYARNYGLVDKWIAHEIIENVGTMMYRIKAIGGNIIRRHPNQIRAPDIHLFIILTNHQRTPLRLQKRNLVHFPSTSHIRIIPQVFRHQFT